MNKIFTLLICSFFALNVHAQIPDGSFAPNFEAPDINGEVHNLHDLLADGYKVVIDFSTTWCGPCWSYHETGTLEDLYEQYGPDGSQEIYVLFVESDDGTTMEDLMGNTPATQGNWLEGTKYPIIDDGAYIASLYGIDAYPTIVTVCGNARVYSTDRFTVQGYVDYANNLSCQPVESDVAVGNTKDISLCDGPVNATVDLTNVGTQNISSMKVTLEGCDACPITKDWSGDLAYMQRENLVFEDVEVPLGAHEYTFSIENTDPFTDNDRVNQNVYVGYVDADVNWTVEFKSDCYPSESSWEVINELGEVVQSSPIYGDADTEYTETFGLPAEGCYTVRFYDSYGDGLNGSSYAPDCTIDGYFRIFSSAGMILETDGTDQFAVINENTVAQGSLNTNDFDALSDFVLSPNPTTDFLNISFNNAKQTDVNLNIVDVMGKTIYSNNYNNVPLAFSDKINVSNFGTGVFLLSVQTQEGSHTQKFIIE